VFTTEVQCSKCGATFSPDKVLTVCAKCSGALLYRYDLKEAASKISKEDLAKREDTFWKFIELLPLTSAENAITLGEPYTPILQLPKSHRTDFKNVYLKDDGRLPTGTFKARGMAVAVSKLKELGIRRIAIPSAGNAAGALAAYGSRAGMEIYAFMPKNVPESNLKECALMGAKIYLVDGLINHAGEIVKRLEQKQGWFNISTNKQPYRFEGYKAIAYEIAEQFDWQPPDTIVFPTGGGEGTIGLWKGFNELRQLGWTDKTPRLIVVQSTGCAPLVKAYEENEREVKEPWKNAETIAAGLNVPSPYASYLILRAIRETGGTAMAVSDEQILASMKELLRMGIYACPEAASTLTALEKIRERKLLDVDEKILLYLTGNATKYFDIIQVERKEFPTLSRNADSL
jgi:threonine synthase